MFSFTARLLDWKPNRNYLLPERQGPQSVPNVKVLGTKSDMLRTNSITITKLIHV